MIEVAAEVMKRADDAHELVFVVDGDSCAVTLTSKEGSLDLKKVYEKLLTLLLRDEVRVQLREDGPVQSMFFEVCREYITSLNADLATVRSEILAEGLGEE